MDTADEILHNALIYTLDPRRPWSTSMAVGDGKILAVGDRTQNRGPATRVRDMRGAFVMPGLVDVHNHHALAGHEERQLRLPPGATVEKIVAAVRGYAATLKPGEWVTGGVWDSTLLPALADPAATRALDDASAGHPVLLIDDSRHNRWASTRALDLAGLGVSGSGRGARSSGAERSGAGRSGTGRSGTGRSGTGRSGTGRSGLLLEADGLRAERARQAASPLTSSQHREASRRAIEILHAHGITAFQDAGVSLDIMRALAELDDAGELRAWVVTSMLVNDHIFGFDPVGAGLIAAGGQYRSEHHRPDFIKIFLDGTPPAGTAAFLDGTALDGTALDGAGRTTMDHDELTGWLRQAHDNGLSAKIHCAGDAAVRMVLDCVEALGSSRPRLVQIAHGQFIAPEDLPRLARLGVSADISPFLWVPGVIPDAIAQVRPAGQAAKMQPNRSLLDLGALVAGGSDWPVSPLPDLWYGIEGLVTRQDPAGEHPGTLWAEQAITLDEAVAVFTRNAATAMGLGDVTGSLECGKSADYVVLDRDPFRGPAGEIARTTTIETVFAGQRVYEKA